MVEHITQIQDYQDCRKNRLLQILPFQN